MAIFTDIVEIFVEVIIDEFLVFGLFYDDSLSVTTRPVIMNTRSMFPI